MSGSGNRVVVWRKRGAGLETQDIRLFLFHCFPLYLASLVVQYAFFRDTADHLIFLILKVFRVIRTVGQVSCEFAV